MAITKDKKWCKSMSELASASSLSHNCGDPECLGYRKWKAIEEVAAALAEMLRSDRPPHQVFERARAALAEWEDVNEN